MDNQKTFEEKLKDLSAPTDIKDIDFRVQSVNNGGFATILAYKDARYDMRRLDETVGPLNWQRKHMIIEGNLYCAIGIYNPTTSEWVWKMDVGVESYTEKEKGQASDSFKRAGFNWGIGRDLYDFPKITVKLEENEKTKKGDRITAAWNFQPNSWTWKIIRDENTGEILALGGQQKVKQQDGTFNLVTRFKYVSPNYKPEEKQQ